MFKIQNAVNVNVTLKHNQALGIRTVIVLLHTNKIPSLPASSMPRL